MVDTGIFTLTFIYLPFNSLFICLKSELFTYCLECGVKRLGHGWIGAIQILIIITIIIDMKMTRFQKTKKGFALSLVLKARVFRTRKWPVRIKGVSEKYSRHLRLKFPIRVCS